MMPRRPTWSALLLALLPAGVAVPAAVAVPAPGTLHAQASPRAVSQEHGVVPAALLIRQLDGVKRVLMIGAHPDDEDTSMLAALARGEGAQVAYLSLNRGEGGQNLIGPEMDEGLGIIRTGELLAARSLDGAAQYFTRAFDFGFSKSAEETFGHWPREEVLDDVVRVIRTFRPQVVVSVFSGTPRDGHGQHQVAGMLAEEAFEVAGDADRFADHLVEGLEAWEPQKFYRLVWRAPEDATLAVETGRFDPLLGRSHFQLAMESRSQHRSQDMGAAQPAGPRLSRVELVASRVPLPEGGETSLFAGIDTTLPGQVDEAVANGGRANETNAPGGGRDSAGAGRAESAGRAASGAGRGAISPADEATLRNWLAAYRAAVAEAVESLNVFRPGGAVPALARALAEARAAAELAGDPASQLARVLHEKSDLVEAALLAAAGVVVDVRVDRALVVPGEPVRVEVELWNGGPFTVEDAVPELALPPGWQARGLRRDPTGRSVGGPFGGAVPGGPATPAPMGGFEPASVPPGGIVRWSFQVNVPHEAELSRPYYLAEERDGALYRWPADPELQGRPGNPPLMRGSVTLRLSGDGIGGSDGAATAPPTGSRGDDQPVLSATAGAPVVLSATRTASFVGVDKALGEFRKPVLVVPALSVAAQPGALAWPRESAEPRTVTVRVDGYGSGTVRGTVVLEVPEGWSVTPARHTFEWDARESGAATAAAEAAAGAQPEDAAPSVEEEDTAGNGDRIFAFRVRPAEGGPGTGFHRFRAAVHAEDGAVYREGFDLIDYPHIERVAHFRPAEARVSVFPVRVAEGVRVGYVMGSGDAGFEALRQLGMDVQLLQPDAVRSGDLGRFDAIVLGARVYETRPDVVAANDRFLDFARRGGTLVVQYNKYEFPAGDFAPFPVEMSRPHDRVTDPDAPVTLLEPGSPVFHAPNRITAADFEGWVQERGLYFLSEWDARYRPLLGMADPGEDMKRGSLVVAPVGDGLYIYTGLAFFRQLPAGVPGAYRLLANLVSLRAHEWAQAHGDGSQTRRNESEPEGFEPRPQRSEPQPRVAEPRSSSEGGRR